MRNAGFKLIYECRLDDYGLKGQSGGISSFQPWQRGGAQAAAANVDFAASLAIKCWFHKSLPPQGRAGRLSLLMWNKPTEVVPWSVGFWTRHHRQQFIQSNTWTPNGPCHLAPKPAIQLFVSIGTQTPGQNYILLNHPKLVKKGVLDARSEPQQLPNQLLKGRRQYG